MTVVRMERVRALVRGARLRTAAPLRMRFDVSDPQAAAWAKRYAAALVSDIDAETLKALRTLLARVFKEGIPPARAARMIRSMVGLTERQAQAVLAVRAAIESGAGRKVWAGGVAVRVPEGGASSAFVNRVAKAYTSRLLRQRALLIARTETISAANEGQNQLWAQAVESGLLNGTEKREWIASQSEPCPVCQRMNGQVRGLTEPFDAGKMGLVMAPPAHPGCRCGQGLKTPETRKRRAA